MMGFGFGGVGMIMVILFLDTAYHRGYLVCSATFSADRRWAAAVRIQLDEGSGVALA